MSFMRISLNYGSLVGEKNRIANLEIGSEKQVSDLINEFYLQYQGDLDSKEVVREELILVNEGTYISSDLTLHCAKIEETSKIEVKKFPRTVEKFGGFQLIGTTFHNMGRYEKVKEMKTDRNWASSAPKYRVMHPGMNLECKCTKRGCKWKGKRQIVPLGYGTFDITELFATTKCGECGTRIEFLKFRKAGFTKCRYKFNYISENFDRFLSDWIVVPFKPCWLEGSINGDDSVRYRRLEFIVEKFPRNLR